MFRDYPVLVKGGGDLATGAVARLHRAGFPVAVTELPGPMAVRRTVSLSEAVLRGRFVVEDLLAVRAEGLTEIRAAWDRGELPVVVDPGTRLAEALRPAAFIDATIAKRNLGTHRGQARAVVGVGPGFTAGVDVHAVVETERGHNLGRVYYAGAAAPDSGEPGSIDGFTTERVLRAPVAGAFRPVAAIGDQVRVGDRVAEVQDEGGRRHPVISDIAGVVRGLLWDGVVVSADLKVGDVDPTGEAWRCFLISDKALAVGGGVLEAVLSLLFGTAGLGKLPAGAVVGRQ